MINLETVKALISKYAQPLDRGIFNKTNGEKVKLTDLIPFGTRDDFTNTSFYGVVSRTPKKVFGYFLNLFGKSSSPIIIAHLDQIKPEPTKDGEVIFYCRKPDGTAFPVTIKLDPDGELIIKSDNKVKIETKEAEIVSDKSTIKSSTIDLVADTKVSIKCDDIELGKAGLEKIVNGETFMEKFNNHPHVDFFGLPTNPPTTPMVEETDLSGKVKGAK